MGSTILSLRAAWENFYVIIGSSAAALTGLQFVVIVLGVEVDTLGDGSGTRAFGTPTIVHFCAALLIAAIVSAPWPTLTSVGIGLGVCGLVGCVYMLVVIRHARRQTQYQPVFEDWLWHGALPLLAYLALLAAAILLWRQPIPSLFVIGGATLLLLFIGIHNAWDTVTYMALLRRRQPEKPVDPEPRPSERC